MTERKFQHHDHIISTAVWSILSLIMKNHSFIVKWHYTQLFPNVCVLLTGSKGVAHLIKEQ